MRDEYLSENLHLVEERVVVVRIAPLLVASVFAHLEQQVVE